MFIGETCGRCKLHPHACVNHVSCDKMCCVMTAEHHNSGVSIFTVRNTHSGVTVDVLPRSLLAESQQQPHTEATVPYLQQPGR